MSNDFQCQRTTTRLQNWNYSSNGLYFVTIKTKFGESYLGEVIDNQVELNDIGREVERQWLLTPSVRSDMNLFLDEFIVMPNHFHGIIGIGQNAFNSSFITTNNLDQSRDSMPAVRTTQKACKSQKGGIFGPQTKNLGSIMRGFKSSVTMWCRIHRKLFDWQSR